MSTPTLISLFTGAGGLDLGLERAGFIVGACVERDASAQGVLKANRPEWARNLFEDVQSVTADQLRIAAGRARGEIALISAGPPCQPFSKARLWAHGELAGVRDERAQPLKNLLQIVGELLPRAILIENVAGFVREGRRGGALTLLEAAFRRINKKAGTSYDPATWILDAAEYGLPQHRRRAFIVAFRDGQHPSVPTPTHGAGNGARKPLVTAWQALGGLNLSLSELRGLQPTGRWAELLPTIPEGSNYLWHTSRGGGMPLFGWRTRYWSFLLKLARSMPSWTISASPGPATGPFHWENRLLSIRELARLQGFPDSVQFPDSRRVAHRLIGNAVPPLLGEVIGRAILTQLGHFHRHPPARPVLLPYSVCRKQIRSILRTAKVPRHFGKLAGAHAAHPGTGLGPGAASRAGNYR
jgi:DNA (cytosine-5)-methyltransferase 1